MFGDGPTISQPSRNLDDRNTALWKWWVWWARLSSHVACDRLHWAFEEMADKYAAGRAYQTPNTASGMLHVASGRHFVHDGDCFFAWSTATGLASDRVQGELAEAADCDELTPARVSPLEMLSVRLEC
jgi:hypothetical protein